MMSDEEIYQSISLCGLVRGSEKASEVTGKQMTLKDAQTIARQQVFHFCTRVPA